MYDVLFDVRILTLFNILDLIFLSDVNYFCNMTILYTLDVYEINVSQWNLPPSIETEEAQCE